MYCTTHKRPRSSKLSASGCLTTGSASTWSKRRSSATLNVFAASAADSFAGGVFASLPAGCALVSQGKRTPAAMMPQKPSHRPTVVMRFMAGLTQQKERELSLLVRGEYVSGEYHQMDHSPLTTCLSLLRRNVVHRVIRDIVQQRHTIRRAHARGR